MRQENEKEINMRVNEKRDDQEDIVQMSEEIFKFISEKFDDNDIFICLNSLTNCIYVLLEDISDSDEDFKDLIERFCLSLMETYKHEKNI